MTDQQINYMAQWASNVAHEYNKSITYVLMQLHEAMNQHVGIEAIKEQVLSQMIGGNV